MSGLEDIIFENRNKEYGSYELRKKYPKYILLGLIISLGSVFLITVILFIILNSDLFFQSKAPAGVSIESLQLVDISDLRLPEPPAVSQEQISNLAKPEIVDTTIHVEEKKAPPKDNSKTQKDSVVSNKNGNLSNDGESTNGDSLLYVRVDEMPEFIDGNGAIARFLRDNLQELSKKVRTRMKIVVQFTVSKTGESRNVSIVTGGDSMVNGEIVRVVSMMRWKPGRQGGRPISVMYWLPITI